VLPEERLRSEPVTRGSGYSRASTGLRGDRQLALSVLPYLALVPVAAAATLAGRLAWAALIAVTIASAACAAGRAAHGWVQIVNMRETADRWIISRSGVQPTDALLQARLDELVSAKSRTQLAAALRRIATNARQHGWKLATIPTNQKLRPYADELARIADALGDTQTPVSARGIAMVNQLISQGGSPLYDSRQAEALPSTLRFTLLALER
jgi:hypothetical protein